MSAMKKEDLPTKETRISEADLESILAYMRSSNSHSADLKIKNFKRILRDARRLEAEISGDLKADKHQHRHLTSTLATALSGSAVVGLTTAIIAPAVPILAVATATMGLVAGWLAAARAEHNSDEEKKFG